MNINQCNYPVGRLSIYREALKDYKSKSTVTFFLGFCGYFQCKSNGEISVYSEKDFQTLLPELYATKPQNSGAFWFPKSLEGQAERTKCLEIAIKNLKLK